MVKSVAEVVAELERYLGPRNVEYQLPTWILAMDKGEKEGSMPNLAIEETGSGCSSWYGSEVPEIDDEAGDERRTRKDQLVPNIRIRPKPPPVGRLINYHDDPELSGIFPLDGCARTAGKGRFNAEEKEELRMHWLAEARRQYMQQRNNSRPSLEDTGAIALGTIFWQDKCYMLARSPIHGFGIYALNEISRGEIITEYTGELVRRELADLRERGYAAQGMDSTYMFCTDEDHVVDATKKGNLARFINHSCQPNCRAKSTDNKVFYIASRNIYKDEELTVNYRIAADEDDGEKYPCHCNAPRCKGYM